MKSGQKTGGDNTGKRKRRGGQEQTPEKWALPPMSLLAPARVSMRQILESSAWTQSKTQLPIILGQDEKGNPLIQDLAALPNLLIGCGKAQNTTAIIKSILAGLIYSRTPDELRLILIDPTGIGPRDDRLPHLLAHNIIFREDLNFVLSWALQERDRRSNLFRLAKVRGIASFNRRRPDSTLQASKTGEPDRLSHIVILIGDLWVLARKDPILVRQLYQLAASGWRAGIHLIVATRRPGHFFGGHKAAVMNGRSVRLGLNFRRLFPARVALKMKEKADRLAILGQRGVDKLNEEGLLLVRIKSSRLIRAQQADPEFDEVKRMIEFWVQQGKPCFDLELQSYMLRKARMEK